MKPKPTENKKLVKGYRDYKRNVYVITEDNRPEAQWEALTDNE